MESGPYASAHRLTCTSCGEPLPRERNWCKSCRSWSFANYKVDDEITVLLSDARLSEVERISLGFPELDAIYGKGGIARTSVNLIGGAPGAGKTTLWLQHLDAILSSKVGKDREGLVIATEQSPNEIRDYSRRIGVQHENRIRIVKATGGLPANLYELVEQFKPCVLVIDSLTKLVGEDMALAVTVAEQMKSLAVDLKMPVLLINQVTKDLDHAGLKKLQHAPDSNLMLDKDDETGERIYYSTKNRFGESPLSVSLRMTEQGLVYGYQSEEDDRNYFPKY